MASVASQSSDEQCLQNRSYVTTFDYVSKELYNEIQWLKDLGICIPFQFELQPAVLQLDEAKQPCYTIW